MISDSLFRKYYGNPGDPKYDGTLVFYSMLRREVRPNWRILDLGAGPGKRDRRCILKGEVAEVVGADIDPVVLSNPDVDTAFVIEDGKLPFSDESFDLAYSDYVIEHVERPAQFLAEVSRVLKPGGSYFFRTPNIYHYIALASYLTPHWVHSAIVHRVWDLPEDKYEPWPTFYRMNSRRALRRSALEAGFKKIILEMVECEPSYLKFHTLPFLAGVAYERLVNSSQAFAALRANIFGQLVK